MSRKSEICFQMTETEKKPKQNKRQGNSDRKDSKRRRVSARPTSPNHYDIEGMRRLILDGKGVEEGKPVSYISGEHPFTWCFWKGNEKEKQKRLRETFRVWKEFPDLFVASHSRQVAEDVSTFCFNMNIVDYPLTKYVDELYLSSSGYAPLQEVKIALGNSGNKGCCVHSLLRLVKVYEGVVGWFRSLRSHDKDGLYWFFGTGTVEECASTFYSNSWVCGANTEDHSDKFSAVDIRLSPVLVTHDGPVSSSCGKRERFLVLVVKEIGRRIFRLTRSECVKKQKSPVAAPFFRPVDRLFTFLDAARPEAVKMSENLGVLQRMCEGVVSMLASGAWLPEMAWKASEKVDVFVAERCLILKCCQREKVEDFLSRVTITGSARWLVSDQVPYVGLFGQRPVLLSFDWTRESGLVCRIVFNRVLQIRNAIKTFGGYDCRTTSSDNSLECTRIVRMIPPAIDGMVQRLATICGNDPDKGLPPGTLIERTYVTFINDAATSRTKELELGISLYGIPHGNIRKTIPGRMGGGFPYMLLDYGQVPSVVDRSHPSTITDLLEFGIQQKADKNRTTVWELGVFILYVYKTLTKRTLNRADLPSLRGHVDRLLCGRDSRLFPWGFRGGDALLYLCGLVFTNDACNRPFLSDLVSHRIYRNWVLSDDLSEAYRDGRNDEEYERNSVSETQGLDNLLNDHVDSSPVTVPLVINAEWTELSGPHSLSKVIHVFTNSLKTFNRSGLYLRNRMSIPISFAVAGGTVKDVGYGRGLFQDAVTVYFQAVRMAGMFCRIGEDAGEYCHARLNENHWYCLGVLLNHCLLNDFLADFERPVHFWKILVNGPSDARFDLFDLYELDPKVAESMASLAFMGPDEIRNSYLDLQDVGDPLLSGPVTGENVFHYARLWTRKKILDGYERRFLDAVHEGFKSTVPEYRPTPSLMRSTFSPEKTVTFDLLVMYFKAEGMEHPHTIDCMMTYSKAVDRWICSSASSHIIQCPVSCLGNFLRSADRETLSKFVRFITGSPLLGPLGPQSQIHVGTVRCDEPDYLPTARTCHRYLQLPIMSPSVRELPIPFDRKIFENTQRAFDHKMMYALENSPSFGFA